MLGNGDHKCGGARAIKACDSAMTDPDKAINLGRMSAVVHRQVKRLGT